MLKVTFFTCFLLMNSFALAGVNEEFLEYAAKGYEDDIIELLENDKSGDLRINFQDANGNTALHHAIMNKKMKIVEILLTTYPLSAQLLPNLVNIDNQTPLLLAIEKCLECATVLLDKRSDLDLEAGHITSLRAAINNKNDNLASKLIQHGADTSQVSLLYFLVINNFPLTLKEFVNNNAIVNTKFANRQTALMRASFLGLKVNAKILIESHPALNLRDDFGNTALHYAAFNFGYSIYKSSIRIDETTYNDLIQAGAKTDLLNNKNQTAEQILEINRNYFTTHDNFKKILKEIITTNPNDHRFSITDSNNLMAIQFEYIDGNSATSRTIETHNEFFTSFNEQNLTFSLNQFNFKLPSIEKLNELKKCVSDLKKYAQELNTNRSN